MDASLPLLLNLFAAAAPPDAEMPAAPPLELDAPAILSTVAPPASAQVLARLLAEAAAGMPAEELLPQLQALAATVDGPQARVAELAGQLETIAALRRADRHGALAQASLDLGTSPLTGLVTLWHLESAPGEPPVSVVCRTGLSQAERHLRLRGDSFVERRVTLRYSPDDPFPLVEVTAPVMTALDGEPAMRGPWRQLALPDYDLQVFSEQGRPLGLVRTRLLAAPIELAREPLGLTLGAQAGAQLVATELVDASGAVALCVIAWPPLGPGQGA